MRFYNRFLKMSLFRLIFTYTVIEKRRLKSKGHEYTDNNYSPGTVNFLFPSF